MNLYEFEVSLVFIVSSKAARAIYRLCFFKKKNKKQKLNKTKNNPQTSHSSNLENERNRRGIQLIRKVVIVLAEGKGTEGRGRR